MSPPNLASKVSLILIHLSPSHRRLLPSVTDGRKVGLAAREILPAAGKILWLKTQEMRWVGQGEGRTFGWDCSCVHNMNISRKTQKKLSDWDKHNIREPGANVVNQAICLPEADGWRYQHFCGSRIVVFPSNSLYSTFLVTVNILEAYSLEFYKVSKTETSSVLHHLVFQACRRILQMISANNLSAVKPCCKSQCYSKT
jgi:hypothetical protein